MLKADDLRLMAQLMEEAARNLSAVMETDIAEREQFRQFLPDELDGSAGMLREYADTVGVALPETVPIEEYRRVVARCIELGEKVAAGVSADAKGGV